jgi:hypothetical protein
MPNSLLSQNEIEEKLRSENLDEWLNLWWVSQGGELRNRRLKLIAEVLPFSPTREIGPTTFTRYRNVFERHYDSTACEKSLAAR